MTFIEWATKWHIPPAAVEDLCRAALYVAPAEDDDSEARVQSEIRLAAAKQGHYLFRNNNGAGQLASGSWVRFGLGNDSAKLNEQFKSADLIGWQRVLVTQAMVGAHVAQFLSVEVKRRNWKFAATKEEMAQVRWAALVNAQGGRALITNTDGVLTAPSNIS
jgi:hypothetical protein